MTLATFYLLVACALIFGACLVAAKHAFPHLHARIFAGLALIAVLTVVLIWTLLAAATRQTDAGLSAPATQPTPLLQPNPD
jgi:hypothetical protein